jgi:hypothetical protein
MQLCARPQYPRARFSTFRAFIGIFEGGFEKTDEKMQTDGTRLKGEKGDAKRNKQQNANE